MADNQQPVDEQEDKEYVVALDEKGNPQAVSAALAKYNGYTVIKGGYSSKQEALGAINEAPSPVQAETERVQNPPDPRVFDYGSPGIVAQDQVARRKAENEAMLARIAFPDGGMTAPIEGSPESVAFGMQPQPGSVGGGPPNRIASAADRYQGPRSPVDMYGPSGVFAGTWAEDTPQSVFNTILAGQMTPGGAVNNITAAAGMPTYGQRDFLEDVYSNYDTFAMLANPGESFPDPAQRYVGAGDMVQQFMQPSDGVANINGAGLYDNMFSQAYIDQVTGLAQGDERGKENPGEFERDMVLNNVAVLAPYIGQENAAWITGQVSQMYDAYVGQGYSSSMSFTDFLRANGAEDWV